MIIQILLQLYCALVHSAAGGYRFPATHIHHRSEFAHWRTTFHHNMVYLSLWPSTTTQWCSSRQNILVSTKARHKTGFALYGSGALCGCRHCCQAYNNLYENGAWLVCYCGNNEHSSTRTYRVGDKCIVDDSDCYFVGSVQVLQVGRIHRVYYVPFDPATTVLLNKGLNSVCRR